MSENFLDVDDIVLAIAGSGDMDLGLNADDIEVDIAGSGNMFLEGTGDDLDIAMGFVSMPTLSAGPEPLDSVSESTSRVLMVTRMLAELTATMTIRMPVPEVLILTNTSAVVSLHSLLTLPLLLLPEHPKKGACLSKVSRT